MVDVKSTEGNLKYLRDSMNRESYFIVRNVFTNFTDDDIATLKESVQTPIFQHYKNPQIEEDESVNDNKRLQLCLSLEKQPMFLKEISRTLRKKMCCIFRKTQFIQSHASVLLSLKGCMAQDLHYDYPPDRDTSQISYGCIVFLQDGGKLLIERGSKILEPHFDKGDMVVFKGSKLHGGSSYDTDNMRVHYYFDCQRSYVRQRDVTYRRYEHEVQYRQYVKSKQNQAICSYNERKKKFIIQVTNNLGCLARPGKKT